MGEKSDIKVVKLENRGLQIQNLSSSGTSFLPSCSPDSRQTQRPRANAPRLFLWIDLHELQPLRSPDGPSGGIAETEGSSDLLPAVGPRRSGVQPWYPRAPCWILPEVCRNKALTLKGWQERAWAPKSPACGFSVLLGNAITGACLTKILEFSLGISSLCSHENIIGPPLL